MKDLSIEGKAKQYDEAVRKAKDIIKYYKTHNRGGEASIDDLETIFPELKESEDEKIKKELICFLETEIPQCDARDKYIDWLEELGEEADPNMSNNNDDDIDICDTCKDGQHCSESLGVKINI